MAQRPATYNDISGLLFWFDPASGYTIDVNGYVSQWVDRKGLVTLTPFTSGKGAKFNPTYRNNKPYMVGIGGNAESVMTGTLPAALKLSNISVLASGYLDLNDNGNWRRLMGFGNDADQNSASIQIVRAGTGNKLIERTLGGGATSISWAYQDKCVIVTKEGTSGIGYVDGVQFVTGAFAATISGTVFRVLGGLQYVDQWPGGVAGVAGWDHPLTTAERQMAEGIDSWSTGKNGSNLAADHPYKNAAPTVDDGTGGATASTSDTGVLTDTAVARAAAVVAAADTGALVDTVVVSVNVVLSLADTLAATETATATAAVALSTSDTGTLSDGSVSSSASSGSTSDVLVPVETVGLSVAAVVTASDVLVPTEGAPGVSATAVVSTADAAPLGDTATATASSPGNGGLSDTAALTDAATARAAVSLAAVDALTATDTATARAAVSLATSDALVASDAASVAVNVILATSDALALTEGQPVTAAARAGTADAGALSDVYSMSANATAVLVDSWTYSETIRYDVVLPVGSLLADVATLNDAATVRVGVSFGSGDALVPREAFTVRVGVAFGTKDTLVLTDVCSFTVGFWYDVTGGGFPESPWKEL